VVDLQGQDDDCDDPRAAALRGRIADRARKLNEVERVRERPSCMALKWWRQFASRSW
jgi:hypothetical protein